MNPLYYAGSYKDALIETTKEGVQPEDEDESDRGRLALQSAREGS